MSGQSQPPPGGTLNSPLPILRPQAGPGTIRFDDSSGADRRARRRARSRTQGFSSDDARDHARVATVRSTAAPPTPRRTGPRSRPRCNAGNRARTARSIGAPQVRPDVFERPRRARAVPHPPVVEAQDRHPRAPRDGAPAARTAGDFPTRCCGPPTTISTPRAQPATSAFAYGGAAGRPCVQDEQQEAQPRGQKKRTGCGNSPSCMADDRAGALAVDCLRPVRIGGQGPNLCD